VLYGSQALAQSPADGRVASHACGILYFLALELLGQGTHAGPGPNAPPVSDVIDAVSDTIFVTDKRCHLVSSE
jgi:hypothetical protein